MQLEETTGSLVVQVMVALLLVNEGFEVNVRDGGVLSTERNNVFSRRSFKITFHRKIPISQNEMKEIFKVMHELYLVPPTFDFDLPSPDTKMCMIKKTYL